MGLDIGSFVGGLGQGAQNVSVMQSQQKERELHDVQIKQAQLEYQKNQKEQEELDKPRTLGSLMSEKGSPDSEMYRAHQKFFTDNGLMNKDGMTTIRQIKTGGQIMDLRLKYYDMIQDAHLKDAQAKGADLLERIKKAEDPLKGNPEDAKKLREEAKKNEFGDLLVKIEIVLPEHLSAEELALFTKLAALRERK